MFFSAFLELFRSHKGTREGCILSLLLFLIFFADAMRVQARANLEEGAIMMGPSSKIGDSDLTESDQDLDEGIV